MTLVPAADTNVVPLPTRSGPAPAQGADDAYLFTEKEQALLCRWYSAMRYAFPGAEVFLVVSHRDQYSVVGLTQINGCSAPAGMLFKNIEAGVPMFAWVTEHRIEIGPTPRLSDITERHVAAAAVPDDESLWLDRPGWTAVLNERIVYEHH